MSRIQKIGHRCELQLLFSQLSSVLAVDSFSAKDRQLPRLVSIEGGVTAILASGPSQAPLRFLGPHTGICLLLRLLNSH